MKIEAALVCAQTKVSKDAVLDWFRENPNPSDEQVHEWAEEIGADAHDLETVIYKIVTDHVQMLDAEE